MNNMIGMGLQREEVREHEEINIGLQREKESARIICNCKERKQKSMSKTVGVGLQWEKEST